MSGEDPFFPDATGGSSGEAADPAAAASAGFVDAGSPPPVAYGMQEPAAYDLGGAAGGGGDQFGVVGDGEQFGGDGEQFGGGGGGGEGGGLGGGGGDQFEGMPLQASSTPYQPKPTDPYSLEETAGVMEAAQIQFDAGVKERAEKEATKAAEVKRLAEEELDGFYDERTDEVARRQARSREQEETFLKGVSASIEESTSNPWARICDLVDLKKPVISAKSSFSAGAGASGGGGSGGSRKGSATAQSGMEEEDVFRATEKMRSLIIQMKADTAEGNAGGDTG
ncbi:unnamed protein product [Ectocarpus fasciculatus]